MPRLQILKHKSYHPYLEKNKQRVREDEAKAAAEELAKEQKRIDADSEVRLNLLRRRAGSPSFREEENGEDDNLPSTSTSREQGSSLLERHRKEKARAEKKERKAKERLEFDFPSESARRSKGKERDLGLDSAIAQPIEQEEGDWVEGRGDQSGKWDVGGHLNFFADLETNTKYERGTQVQPNANKPVPTLAELAKKKREQELDQFTMYLSRPPKETNPWYGDKDLKRVDEKETGESAEERREKERRKDLRSKERNDPLTTVTKLLSTHSQHGNSRPGHARPQGSGAPRDATRARHARESTERERALALIAKSKQPTNWADTPSTQAGGGRSWIDDFERQKDRAGNRYFNAASNGASTRDRVEAWRGGSRAGVANDRGWEGRQRTGRSWEV